jgi:DNA-binding HxlR family transcriptional regulator
MPDFRSNCPLCSALDIMGDKWTLLIVRDMIVFHKSTFMEFERSDEKIAVSILAKRLKWLQQEGIITKQKMPENKKTNIYLLTEKGLAFTPVIMELVAWSEFNLREIHSEMTDYGVATFISNKSEQIQAVQKSYRDFANPFGSNS